MTTNGSPFVGISPAQRLWHNKVSKVSSYDPECPLSSESVEKVSQGHQSTGTKEVGEGLVSLIHYITIFSGISGIAQ